jgi:hypothetical protein
MSEIAKNVRIVGFRIASVPKDSKLPNLGTREVEMVDLTTVGNAKYTVIPMRIHDAMRDTTGLWDIIEPHYSAWKKGFEIPTTGTPLTSWQGISREQIEAIRIHGIYTVEDVAQMTDDVLRKCGGIGMQAVREAARAWEKTADRREVSAEIAARDADIEALKQQVADLTALISRDNVSGDITGTEEPIKRRPGRPRKEAEDEVEAA